MTNVASDEVARLFLEFSDRKLMDQTKKLTMCVEKMTEEQVWARGGAHENAVGNLMIHLCGNMRQWIMHGVGGKADVRTRDAEFSADGEMTKSELMALFTTTVEEARGIIASLPHQRLNETIHPQGRETSVLGAIYQVVGHVQEHVGQVILLTKQMIGTDLDLTMPRKR